MSSAAIDKCAACGREGDSLKACTACFTVKYCNRDCQISHRQQHKKACKKRASELYDEKLFREVEPEECPICLLPLPIRSKNTTIEPCCGKRICNGCIYAMFISDEGKNLCAFCRTPKFCSDEEMIKRLKKLMDNGNAEAFYLLASHYAIGRHGLPQDRQRANELNLKAGELGCADGYHNLGTAYYGGRGVEVDMKKAKHYFELAAMKGNVNARHNLGYIEEDAGKIERAYKHWILAAKAGNVNSLDVIKRGFIGGDVTKDEYANTLRAYQKIHDETKSDERDIAASEMQD